MSVKQQAQRELIWRALRKNPEKFFEEFVYIQHPKGRRLFKLRDPQREALREWSKGGNWLTLKARQIGWSTLVAAFCLHKALFFQDYNILIISRGEREAREVLAKVRFMYGLLPPWIRAKGPMLVADTLENMKFSNGSEIKSLPSASNPGRGFSGSLVIIDEWAFLPNPEEAWASIEPVADIGGQIIGLSTANGSGNFFHDQWVRSEEGLTSFKTMFYSWRAVDDRDDEWFARKCREMLPWQRAQEYPNDPEEAFIKSGNPVFVDILDKLQPEMPQAEGYLTRPFTSMPRRVEFRQEQNGPLQIFEWPDASKTYVAAADVAEGLEHGDYSVAHVMDAETGNEVAILRTKADPDLFSEMLFELGVFYGECLLGPEKNNHGLTVITLLRRMGYRHIYRKREHNKIGPQLGVEWGWGTSKVTKPLMIDELAQSLRYDEVKIRSQATIKELRTFVRDEKGRMHGSPHDDCVISLAICNQMRKYAYNREAYGEEGPVPYSVDWWAQSIDVDAEMDKRSGQRRLVGRAALSRSGNR